MGYQRVAATLTNWQTKRGTAYNGELLVFDSDRRLHLKSDFDYELRTAKSAAGEIRSLQVLPQEPISLSTTRVAKAATKAPAAQAPIEKTTAGEVFVRFSAFANDYRVQADGGWSPGTYATTEEDAKNVKTGKEAVARYALPNPTPASYRYTGRPHKDTDVQRGAVEAAFDQPGGGVEVIFPGGTQAGTVDVPPKRIPDE